MTERETALAAMDRIVGDTFGYFEKSAEGYIIAMSDNNRRLSGVPLHENLTEKKISHVNLVTGDMAEESERIDQEILATGEVFTSYAWVRDEGGRWVKFFAMKQRTDKGTILVHTFVAGQTEKISKWVRRLDNKHEVLQLDDSGELFLTRRELQILSLFLDGVPRKTMGEKLFLSVKSIEKYISRIRTKMTRICCDGNSNLLRCLNHTGLTAFLLEKPDWFANDHQRIFLRSYAPKI
ncbi:MAG: hypothetical protein HOC23_12265 [Halieaceae bacterium]|nr:hypothetical protein [Halieaceae bacterium]